MTKHSARVRWLTKLAQDPLKTWFPRLQQPVLHSAEDRSPSAHQTGLIALFVTCWYCDLLTCCSL